MRYSIRTFRFLTFICAVLLAYSANIQAFGQTLPAADTKVSEPAQVEDPFGRATPRGTVQGYLDAVGAEDFLKAARYLDVSDQPLNERKKIGAERAEQLKLVLDRGGEIFDVNVLSSSVTGKGNDELNIDLDRVGTLDRSNRKIPLLLQRVDGGENGQIWQFSESTLRRVPFLAQVTQEGLLDRIMPEALKNKKIGAGSLAHWLAIIVTAALSLIVGYFISWALISALTGVLKNKNNIAGLSALQEMQLPLGVLIGIAVYRVAILYMGVDVVVRETMDRVAVILGWMALAWFAMRFVDGIAEVARVGMTYTNRISSVTVVMLTRRLVKAAIMIFAAIAIFDAIGLDVSTGLAALGIGGLALALGAQRTIENLVGSITVVADKPVQVGDFCKFGDVMGTVEDIGIRSTQVRTLDRTIVTVPNGAFSAMQIENYSVRDEIKFHTVLTMRYETTPDQVRYLLLEIRALLHADKRVNNTAARVRFIALNHHALDIEVLCYVQTTDNNVFLEIQEDLLLQIMDIVKSSGTDFAFPSQTIFLGKDEKPTESDAKNIAKIMKKLNNQAQPSIRDVPQS